jgi:Xaa-Pro aminopeptidase
VLFVPERDPGTERWTGQRLGADRAADVLGIQAALPLEQFEPVLEPLLEDHRVYLQPWPEGVAGGSELAAQIGWLSDRISLPDLANGRVGLAQRAMMRARDEASYARTYRMLERIGGAAAMEGTEASDMARAFEEAGSAGAWSVWLDAYLADYADGLLLDSMLTELREVKTEEELRFLQKAIDITAEAHREALRAIEPGLYEYEVEAVIEYVFHRDGAEQVGFPSIVGSGGNSTILHYESNRRRMREGDLVVMDIGAEYRGYSADVTRTAPVNGRFTKEQRQVYESVLEAQEAAISAVRVGATITELNEAVMEVLARRLEELGVIDNPDDVRRFLPHGVSHYLGLDVHDVGSYGPLPAGAVVTIEPGLYFPPSTDVDERWWNIGVRIEDDVLVTESGPLVLSEDAPRSVEAVESLMREPGLEEARAVR